jgi:hypothetical protein
MIKAAIAPKVLALLCKYTHLAKPSDYYDLVPEDHTKAIIQPKPRRLPVKLELVHTSETQVRQPHSIAAHLDVWT